MQYNNRRVVLMAIYTCILLILLSEEMSWRVFCVSFRRIPSAPM